MAKDKEQKEREKEHQELHKVYKAGDKYHCAECGTEIHWGSNCTNCEAKIDWVKVEASTRRYG